MLLRMRSKVTRHCYPTIGLVALTPTRRIDWYTNRLCINRTTRHDKSRYIKNLRIRRIWRNEPRQIDRLATIKRAVVHLGK